MKPWAQELLWVQRNEQGVIVGMSDKLPQTDDFIPTMPTQVPQAAEQNEK